MKCINPKCGIELNEGMLFCYNCGTKQETAKDTDGGRSDLYTYLAFISYSHRDTEEAAYIEEELRKYHVPAVISSHHPELGKVKFDRIFRDENSFGNGTLEENIRKGLRESKYLIAVCSPNYASGNEDGRNWCDEEVRQFLEYHNGDTGLVIPIIISGRPHGGDEECYSPTLKGLGDESNEALGIDARMVGTLAGREEIDGEERKARDEIFDAIKARLLGLRYGEYRSYIHRERYYKDYVDRNAIPEGIHELTEVEARKRNCLYRFTYREGVLEKVTHENSHGKIVAQEDDEDNGKIVNAEYIYDSRGRLIQTRNSDKDGKLVRVERHVGGYGTVNYYDEKDRTLQLGRSVSLTGKFQDSKKADIKSVQTERDGNGYIVKKTYHRHHNEYAPVGDGDGIYGLEYELDEKGRAVAIWYLNQSGGRMTTRSGVAGKKVEYDGKDNRRKVTFVDAKGNAVPNDRNYAVEVVSHDEVGNVLSYAYYGPVGSPCIEKNTGSFKLHCKYDDRGNKMERAYYGMEGEAVMSKYGYHRECYVCDERGNETERRSFDTEGRLVVGTGVYGYAKGVKKYDSLGNCVEFSLYRDEKCLMLDGKGRAVTRMKYDGRGNCIEIAYYGTEGEPVMSKYGYHRVCCVYDERGNVTEECHYDTEGNLVVGTGDFGSAKSVYRYDDRGNCVENARYRDEKCLMLDGDGIAVTRRKYDSRGNCVEYAYYGTEGEPVMSKYGFHRMCYEHDERGNWTEECHYDTEGNLVVGTGEYGYAKCLQKYDSLGNCVEFACYRDEEHLMLDGDGIAVTRRKYDGRGNCTEYAYYGTDGEAVMSKNGYHRVCWVYDERGNVTEECHYDTEGNLVVGTGDYGYAKGVKKYDSLGNCVEILYFKDETTPMMNTENGGARIVKKYDDRNNPTEFTYYGVDGEPVLSTYGFHRKTVMYDDYGNRTEERCYGVNGEYAVIVESWEDQTYTYAIRIRMYDSRQNCVEDSYYRDDEHLMRGANGYARVTRKYSPTGNLLEENFFDEDNRPVNSSDGYSSVTYEYDIYGNQINVHKTVV